MELKENNEERVAVNEEIAQTNVENGVQQKTEAVVLENTENSGNHAPEKKTKTKEAKIGFGSIAVILEFSMLAAFFVGLALCQISVLWSIGFLFIVFTPILPIAGVAVGICGLTSKKTRANTLELTLSIIAVALPVATVMILSVLFASGVLVIRFM